MAGGGQKWEANAFGGGWPGCDCDSLRHHSNFRYTISMASFSAETS